MNHIMILGKLLCEDPRDHFVQTRRRLVEDELDDELDSSLVDEAQEVWLTAADYCHDHSVDMNTGLVDYVANSLEMGMYSPAQAGKLLGIALKLVPHYRDHHLRRPVSAPAICKLLQRFVPDQAAEIIQAAQSAHRTYEPSKATIATIGSGRGW